MTAKKALQWLIGSLESRKETINGSYQEEERGEWYTVAMNQLNFAIEAAEKTLPYMIDKEFPNGFTSWQGTHFEIVDWISSTLNAEIDDRRKKVPAKLSEIQLKEGRFGISSYAAKLTDKFEVLNAGREWDGEFLEEVWAFVETEVNS